MQLLKILAYGHCRNVKALTQLGHGKFSGFSHSLDDLLPAFLQMMFLAQSNPSSFKFFSFEYVIYSHHRNY